MTRSGVRGPIALLAASVLVVLLAVPGAVGHGSVAAWGAWVAGAATLAQLAAMAGLWLRFRGAAVPAGVRVLFLLAGVLLAGTLYLTAWLTVVART